MADGPARSNGPAPQSVTRVVRLLAELAASPAPLGLADLSRRLSAPKSSLAALLRGLAQEEFVAPSGAGWRLGPGAFALGSALIEARRRAPWADPVRRAMARLAERSGETVLFAVPDGDGETMTYVEVIESRATVRFSVSPGDRRPLYATAGGRALLSAASDEVLARYLDRLRPRRLTDRTETGRRALADAVLAARAAGVAQTVDQAADGVTGTAAPVRDADGTVLGALSVAAPSSRSQDRLAELARLVRDEAAAVSRQLGFTSAGATASSS